jgi:hypothetical protein
MTSRTLVAAAFASALAFASAQANPVDVSYTVAGSLGNWTYSFSVTDNTASFGNGDPFSIYLFGVAGPSLTTDTITATPSGWTDFANIITPPRVVGSTDFFDAWRVGTSFAPTISPGQTLGGFEVLDTSQTPLSSILWMAYGIDPVGDKSITEYDATATYTGPDCFDCANLYNPGFTSTATAAVPEPSTWAMLLLGFAGLSFAGYKRAQRRPITA